MHLQLRSFLTIVGATVLVGAALPANSFATEYRLTAADGQESISFGGAVDIDGDTAVVGSTGYDLIPGAAYVFIRSGSGWTRQAKLSPSNAPGFGSSVKVSGARIVVGTGNGAYVFDRTGDVWSQTGRLTASDAAWADYLGSSIDFDDDVIVLGAPGVDSPGIEDRGAVYTFAADGAAIRTETAKLMATGGTEFDGLGGSIAMDGDTIVAGAPRYIPEEVDGQGAVYTFDRSGAPSRTETAKLTATDGAVGDTLGTTVAIDEGTIVAGAPQDDLDVGSNAGSLYTFAASGAATRTETAKLIASDRSDGDRLGDALDLEGDLIVAGAPLKEQGAENSRGFVYGFSRTGAANRMDVGHITSGAGQEGDRLAYSVAVSGTDFIAGAPSARVGLKPGEGRASIFDSFIPSVGPPIDLPEEPVEPPVEPPVVFKDTRAPETFITTPPKKKVKSKKLVISFRSSEVGSSFQCRFDDAPLNGCSNPTTLKKLKKGKHLFEVRSIDRSRNMDLSWAQARFKVK